MSEIKRGRYHVTLRILYCALRTNILDMHRLAHINKMVGDAMASDRRQAISANHN